MSAITRYTGTSGFSYDSWKSNAKFKTFYPAYLKKSQLFSYYTQYFNFIEINATFYGHPKPETVSNWYNQSPSDFRFLVKANKYITHNKRFLNFDETFTRAFNLYSLLKEKCVGILLQTPGAFVCNPVNYERLRTAAAFAATLPNPYGYQIFIEFRHISWFQPAVYQLLQEIGWSLVCVNIGGECETINSIWDGFTDMKQGWNPPLADVISHTCITVPDTLMFRCHGTFINRAYSGGYDDITCATMISIISHFSKGLIVFDNTDSFEHQLDVDIPGILAFDRSKIVQGETILPHAIADACKTMKLLH